MDVDIQKIVANLMAFTNAKSIFLYGSRARDDFYPESDYEIGVVMNSDKYIERAEIKKQFNIEGVNIFPFIYEEIIVGTLDTPFQKSIYLKELIEGGRTIAGEKIIETLSPPTIMLLDVIQDVRFNLGYSLAATHSHRNNDNETATLHFVKSCLFGTRDLIIFKNKKFLISYQNIVSISKNLNLPEEYAYLPDYALELREKKIPIEPNNLFRNISYLNKYIEKSLVETFKKEGNMVLIK